MKTLIKYEKTVDLTSESKVISSLSNPFYKKEDINPYSRIGVAHNEILELLIESTLESKDYKTLRFKSIKALKSYSRFNSFWNGNTILLPFLDSIIPICFPTGGPFGNDTYFYNNNSNSNNSIDSESLPLLSEVYSYTKEALQSIDLTREDHIEKLIKKINNIEKQIIKLKKTDNFDKKLTLIHLSVFENSILFWNKYDRDTPVLAKGHPIIEADINGAVEGAIGGLITGGPGGLGAGAALGSAISSYMGILKFNYQSFLNNVS